jgi:peptidoglycan/xylan/chitin deacetylase (PgdA/CDA1 family)
MQFNYSLINTTIFAYHHVCTNVYPTITRVTPNQFKKQITYLKKNNYCILKLSDFFLSEKENRLTAIITFDDAFSCLKYNAIDFLKSKKETATLFVITKYVGKDVHWDYYSTKQKCTHLSWEQLREISSEGIELGSHSHSHQDLKSLRENEIWNELEYSKKLLEDKIGDPIHFISYPFGRFDKRIMNICKKIGYWGAVTMNPIPNNNPFSMPRSSVYLSDNLYQFKLKLKKNPPSFFESNKLRLFNLFSRGTIILNNFKRP